MDGRFNYDKVFTGFGSPHGIAMVDCVIPHTDPAIARVSIRFITGADDPIPFSIW